MKIHVLTMLLTTTLCAMGCAVEVTNPWIPTPTTDTVGGGDGSVVDPSTDGGTEEAVCGDGLCEGAETSAGCPQDCGETVPACGDGICDATESAATCPQDCQAQPVCGDGVCDSTESSATCPADCAAPSDLLCFEVEGCIVDCMGGNTALAQGCITSCSQAALPAEAALFNAYYQCLGGCANTQGQVDMACASTQCLTATANCFNGGNSGSGTCAELDPCVAGCSSDTMLQTEGECQRGCFSAASQESLESFVSVIFCFSENCQGLSGTQYQQCATTSINPGGACEVPFATCQDPGPAVVCGDGVCDATEDSTNCPADCGEVTPPGEGACTNEADQSILEDASVDVQGTATDCAIGCLSSADVSACMAQCVSDDTGLSMDCAGCFGGTVSCTMANCIGQCLPPNETSQACLDCMATNCAESFEACAGYPLDL